MKTSFPSKADANEHLNEFIALVKSGQHKNKQGDKLLKLFRATASSEYCFAASLTVYIQVRDYLKSRSVSNSRGTNNRIPHSLGRLIVHGDVGNEGPLILTSSTYQRTCEPNPSNHAQSDTTLREAKNNKKLY